MLLVIPTRETNLVFRMEGTAGEVVEQVLYRPANGRGWSRPPPPTYRILERGTGATVAEGSFHYG